MPDLTHHYLHPTDYETKLERVIERLGAQLVDYEYTGRVRTKKGEIPVAQRPQVASVSFLLRGQGYSFTHTPEQSAMGTVPVTSGVDLFCQLVLALEVVAKLGEWRLSQLQIDVLLSGARDMTRANLPEWCGTLGLEALPNDETDVHRAFRLAAKRAHPDADGGSVEQMQTLQGAYEHGLAYVARRNLRTPGVAAR